MPSAWQSGGAAALPGTVAQAVVRDTEVLWCAAHSWNVAMDGYTVFRKDRWRRAGSVMLHIKELLDECSAPVSSWRQTCWEFLGQDHSKEQPGGCCGRWGLQTADSEEARAEDSNFGALHWGISLTWDFSPLVVCWKGSTTLGRQPRMFLECNYNIFLAQEQGSHDWFVHAGLAFCWGGGNWGWEGSQHCSGCGWFVTGCSSHEVTDVAEPGRWATRLWVSRLTYSGNSLWEAAVKGKSPQKS